MGGEICLLKNGTAEIISLRMWRTYRYNTDTKGELTYSGWEKAKLIKPGEFIVIDATKQDENWLRMQGLCEQVSIHIYYRVYIGIRADHSETLEVAEFQKYGGIGFFTAAANNDKLEKKPVPRDQLNGELELRRSAATTWCLMGFLPFLPTKKQRVKEMMAVIKSIWDGSAAPRAADNCVDEDVGVNQDTRPITAGTYEHKHKGSATPMQKLLQKEGTNCHLSCKDPHEWSPLHIGITEDDASTSTANNNGGLCDTSGGEGNPPISAASTCDVAVEENA